MVVWNGLPDAIMDRAFLSKLTLGSPGAKGCCFPVCACGTLGSDARAGRKSKANSTSRAAGSRGQDEGLIF